MKQFCTGVQRKAQLVLAGVKIEHIVVIVKKHPVACCLWCEWAHCYITYSIQVKICRSNQNSQYLQHHTQICALTTCQFAEMTVYMTLNADSCSSSRFCL